MAHVAYIRVSSEEQNTDRQLDGIAVDRTFSDKVSGATTERPALKEMLSYVRDGDTIHVHSVDRLARSLADLLALVTYLRKAGVCVHFHKEQLLFTSEVNPTQELMLSMMGAVAEFERAIIKERQREGIAKAKAKGVYKGRVKKVDDQAIRDAMGREGASFRKVAAELGVSLSTVQRAMKAA
ncbi:MULTISPECIES: recombinase family protein [Pseudomonas]|uniref:DNA-invertase hin n=1 Tax=Pseudomonas fluorescens TaxID=294 RepID=A0A109KRX2_PSEFL|nr:MULTISPECIES: recombinase family protein [Pseudomonas]KAA6193746.1 resolvase [Pseudomonas lactis]KWV74301.1 DNA-invertase hin [Pseudomonas fluorescens]